MKFVGVIGSLLVLCITFQSILEVDSLGFLAIFELMVGAIEVHNWLDENLDGDSAGRGKKTITPDNDYTSSVQGLREDMLRWREDLKFDGPMGVIKDSFIVIQRHHNNIFDPKRLKKKLEFPYNKDNYELLAYPILREYGVNSPLEKIHETVKSAFNNYTSHGSNWIGYYQKYMDVCVTRLSSMQAVQKLLEDVLWSSRLYYENYRELLKVRDEVNAADHHDRYTGGVAPSKNTFKHKISDWYKETLRVITPDLVKLSRKLYTCGMPNTTETDQAIELKVFTKFFFRECDSIGCSSATRAHECPKTTSRGSCNIYQYCRGKLHGCETIHESDINVCISESSKGQRYQYYENSSISEATDVTYSPCQVRSLDSREGSDFVYDLNNPGPRVGRLCSTCNCTCEEGDYFINLAPVYSNVSNNMVVTGAKFVLSNRMLELHIQQGQSLEYGLINVTTLHWTGPSAKIAKRVSRDEVDKIALSTTMLPSGRVLTGLKLDHEPSNDLKNQGSRIYLRTFSTEYDFKAGKILNHEHVIGGLPFTYAQTELDLHDLISPRKSREDEKYSIKNDVWVTLGTSNGVDGGQSTIPFFDGREVLSNRPTALSGAGLYYKGGETWAGYIGIELHTWDISDYFPKGSNSTFSGSVQDLKNSLSVIDHHHKKILEAYNFLKSRKLPLHPSEMENFRGKTALILDNLTGKFSLFNAHRALRGIIRDHAPRERTPFLHYQDFADQCVSRSSSLQTVSKLLDDVVNSSLRFLNTIRMSQHMMGQTVSEDTATSYQRRISEWINETFAFIRPVSARISRKLYACSLPNTSDKDHSIELKVFSKSSLRICLDSNTPDGIRCDPVTHPEECPEIKANPICSMSRPCHGKFYECEARDNFGAGVISDHSNHERYQSDGAFLTSTINKIRDICHVPNLNDTENQQDRYDTFEGIERACPSYDCTCEEGDYFINLSPVQSNVSRNMVVTGAKFVLKKNLLELHIQQAKVLGNGLINATTREWIGPSTETPLKVSWDHAKKIRLSSKMLPPGHVLTGLRLDGGVDSKSENGNFYIFLRSYYSAYNHKTGHLSSDEPKLERLGSRLPNIELFPSHEEFIENKAWVSLTASNGVNGGQSTIPFFDGQEVTSSIATALSGAGLYYKGERKSAGYIGIELHTYDFSEIIVEDDDAE